MLNEEERRELKERLFEVEKLVLETEFVPMRKEDGNIVWVERIKGDLSLYDIEMAFESNADYFSYFQKEDGSIVTKFDVERKLDRIRAWVYDRVREKASGMRFTRMR